MANCNIEAQCYDKKLNCNMTVHNVLDHKMANYIYKDVLFADGK